MCSMLCGHQKAGFAEFSSSMTISYSENGVAGVAVFKCRHTCIEAAISWRINGSFSISYPDIVDGSIRDNHGRRVYTLTIPTIPEYNGTEVVCVAAFLDGFPLDITSPSTLIIPPGGLALKTMIKWS